MGWWHVEDDRVGAHVKRWRSNYAYWLRKSNWLLIPIYLFAVLIPLYYEATAEIPPTEKLHVTDGMLVIKWIPRRRELTGLQNEAGNIYFTCRIGVFSKKNNCISTFDEAKKLVGKRATIWWFEQTIFPFSTQRRLVRLVVDGQEKISLARTLQATRSASGNARWEAVGLFVFFVAVAVYSGRTARR